jgi:hypothetical protein
MLSCHQQSSISRGSLRVNYLSLNGHTAILAVVNIKLHSAAAVSYSQL